jgi:uncharacterized membrane protein YphA (DoxX/SURF4 family)
VTAQGIGYTAAVVLAAVFAVAGVAKLRDLRATLDDFDALGLPRPEVFARIVPLAELAVAALLLIVPAGGALAALVTLAFFTTFLVRQLRAGVRAPCACFGAASKAPLSSIEVVRNLALMALAGVALAADRPVAPTLTDIVVVVGATLLGAGALRLARGRRRPTAASR